MEDFRFRIIPGFHTRKIPAAVSEVKAWAELGQEAYRRPVVCHIKPKAVPLVIDEHDTSLFVRLRLEFVAFVRLLRGQR